MSVKKWNEKVAVLLLLAETWHSFVRYVYHVGRFFGCQMIRFKCMTNSWLCLCDQSNRSFSRENIDRLRKPVIFSSRTSVWRWHRYGSTCNHAASQPLLPKTNVKVRRHSFGACEKPIARGSSYLYRITQMRVRQCFLKILDRGQVCASVCKAHGILINFKV